MGPRQKNPRDEPPPGRSSRDRSPPAAATAWCNAQTETVPATVSSRRASLEPSQYQRFSSSGMPGPRSATSNSIVDPSSDVRKSYRPCCAAHISAHCPVSYRSIRETPRGAPQTGKSACVVEISASLQRAYDRSVVARPPADRAPENHSSHCWKSRYGEQSLLRRAIG